MSRHVFKSVSLAGLHPGGIQIGSKDFLYSVGGLNLWNATSPKAVALYYFESLAIIAFELRKLSLSYPL